jgi:hypothetical protein
VSARRGFGGGLLLACLGAVGGCATAGGRRPAAISVIDASAGPAAFAHEREISGEGRLRYGPLRATAPCGRLPKAEVWKIRRDLLSAGFQSELRAAALPPGARRPAGSVDVIFLIGAEETTLARESLPPLVRAVVADLDELLRRACGPGYDDPLVERPP